MGNSVSATEAQISETQLAARSAEGGMQAFEELYERHNRRVYSLCLRMTANVSDAEDLSQEVFIQQVKSSASAHSKVSSEYHDTSKHRRPGF